MARGAQARANAAQVETRRPATAKAAQPLRDAASGLSRDGVTRLLTADDLAERWSVSPKQVYRLARESDLPAVKIGRYYRFRLSAVENWEAQQEGVSHGE